MRIAAETEPVTVWANGGVPSRLVWASERWRVIDRPTALSGVPQIDERAPRGNGWRVTMRRASDEVTAVADLVERSGEWTIVHAWF
jgi:hypothetical protein